MFSFSCSRPSRYAFTNQRRNAEINTVKLEALLTNAERWRRKHGAQFEKTKYVPIHFTRNRRINTDAAIDIEGTQVLPSKEGKYLGVIWDQDLKFHAHTNHAVKKGTQFRLAIGSIARETWVHRSNTYEDYLPPSQPYAAIIWHRPEDLRSPATQQQSKFSTVQRQIMKTMLGCFRTTSTDALEDLKQTFSEILVIADRGCTGARHRKYSVLILLFEPSPSRW